MTRFLYPGTFAQFATGLPAASQPFTIWTDVQAGSDVTSQCVGVDGTSAYTPTTTGSGNVLPFRGPDGYTSTLFVSTGGEVRYALTSPTAFDTLKTTVDSLASSGVGGGLTDGAVTTPKIADAAVTGGKLGNSSVSTAAIADGAVTASKLSATAAVNLTSPQVVAGVKTFSAAPIVPTPSAGGEAANKDYVDSKAGSGGGTAVGAIRYDAAQGTLTATQRATARANSASLADTSAMFHVADYGAVGDNATDDRAACAAAVKAATDYIAATGRPAAVVFGTATYYFGSGVTKTALVSTLDPNNSGWSKCGIPVPCNLTAELTLDMSGTTIRLSSNCLNVFFFDKKADHDYCRNVSILRPYVDDGQVTVTGHILIGNFFPGGTKLRYLNVENIYIEDPYFFNIAILDTTTNNPASRVGVAFILDQNGPHTSTSTINTCQGITTVGGRQEGGVGLYNFYSVCAERHYGGGAPVFYDDISIGPGWSHTKPQKTSNGAETSIYVGGAGWAQKVRIDRGLSVNIADDAIEVGSVYDLILTDVECRDPFFESVYLRNTHPIDSLRQKITIKNLRTTYSDALSALTGSVSAPVVLVQDDLYITVNSGGATAGTFTLTVPLNSGAITTAAIAWNATAAQVAAALVAVLPNTLGGAGVNVAALAVTTGPGPGGPLNTAPVNVCLVNQDLDSTTRVTMTSSLTGTTTTPAVTLTANWGVAHGVIRQEDSITTQQGTLRSRSGRSVLGFGGSQLPHAAEEFINCAWRFKNYTYDQAANGDLWLIRPTNPWPDFPTRLLVRDLVRTFVFGNVLGSVAWTDVGIDGQGTIADIDGITQDNSGGSGAARINAVTVAKGTGNQLAAGIKATIRRARALNVMAGAAYSLVQVAGGGLVSSVLALGNDASAMNNPTNAFTVPTTGTNGLLNAARTRIVGNSYKDVASGGLVLPSGTPALVSGTGWQNTLGYTVEVAVSGGTVTAIARGGTTAVYTDLGLTSGTFIVPPGEYLRVTFSAAPTATYRLLP